MKKLAIYLLPFLMWAACTPHGEDPSVDNSTQATSQLDLDLTAAITHENLRLYPIVADAAFQQGNEWAAQMKNLKEGIETPGFYVTEKKPYGRMDDQGAVNALTIQNKSDQDIYLMQGDVVTGGNQDRIIAEDMIAEARSIKDVNVYCVEKGRWQYRSEEVDTKDPEAQKKEKMYAFTGYYNVASNRVRKTVRETRSQEHVWAMVGEVTDENDASTSTSTYAGLEQSNEFTQKRDTYLAELTGQWDSRDDVVGFVAVSGNKIIGMDLFGHAELFRKQYPALLHGYVTDAIHRGGEIIVSDKTMERYAKNVQQKYDRAKKAGQTSSSFFHNDALIHLSEL